MNLHPRSILLLGVGLALAGSELAGQSQIELFSSQLATGSGGSGYFGTDIALLEDLDGDGLRELATLSPGIRILSTSTQRILRHITPAPGTATYPRSLELIGDVDGDGHADLAVGFPDENNFRGAVHVYSIETGLRIRSVAGTAGSRLGTTLCAVGDCNFDGVPDFAAGGPTLDTTGPGGGVDAGVVRVFSGASAALLWEASFGGPGSLCGQSLAALGDHDNDGRPTIAIASPGAERVYIAEILGHPGIVTLQPTQSGTGFGASIASVGDLDGDGARDVIVGEPLAEVWYTRFTWAGYVDAGRVSAYRSVTGAQLWSVVGDPAFPAQLGSGVGEAGDVDLDGVPDVIANGEQGQGQRAVISGANGVPLASYPSNATDPVYLVAPGEDMDGNGIEDLWIGSSSGAGSVSRHTDAGGLLFRYYTRSSGAGAGAAVAILDDLDADGRPEVAIGTPHDPGSGPGSQGSVTIKSGSSTFDVLTIADDNGEFGTAICALSDLDNDGVSDFVVGRPNARFGHAARPGAVTVYSGATRNVIRHHSGQSTGDRFGASVCAVPDADGDGIVDYAVGSPNWTSSGGQQDVGRVQLFSGATGQQLLLRNGAFALARFGTAIDGSPDLDGDGRGELLVGAPGEWTTLANLNAGRVRCYSGASGTELFAVVGSQAAMALGSSIAALGGDVTGDGIPDFVAGAPDFGVVQAGDGRVELRSGADGSLVWSDAGAAGSRLGASVCGPGDLDNDGYADFAVGEPLALDLVFGGRRGLVRLYSGASRAFYSVMIGDDRFGEALASGADLDGDRARDLVVGNPAWDQGSGRVATWSARALGTSAVGTGTAGCGGETNLTLYRPARPAQTMHLRFGPLSAGAVPFLMFGSSSNPVGFPLFGALLHVSSFVTLQLPPMAGAYGEHAISLPNDPGLVGASLSAQVLALWPFACTELAFPLSSSNALDLVVQ